MSPHAQDRRLAPFGAATILARVLMLTMAVALAVVAGLASAHVGGEALDQDQTEVADLDSDPEREDERDSDEDARAAALAQEQAISWESLRFRERFGTPRRGEPIPIFRPPIG